MTDDESVEPTPTEGAAQPGGPSPRTATVVPKRPAPWADVVVLGWIVQLAFLAGVIALGAWLWSNLRTNTERQNLKINFDYLEQPAGFPIPSNLAFRPTQPVKDAIVEGLQNTLRLAIVGLILATVLGVLLGIARLSQNFVLRNAARVYVEFIRNVPLLLILTLTYIAIILQQFPPAAQSWTWQPLGESTVRFAVGLALIIAATVVLNRLAQRRDAYGTPRLIAMCVGVVAAAVALWFVLWAIVPSWTVREGTGTVAIVNVRGASTAWVTTGARNLILATLIVIVIAFGAGWIAQRRADRSGGRPFRGLVTLLAAVIALVAVWLAFGIDITLPAKSGLRTAGGITMTPEYLAALLALVVYTSSHIAEIVRGSIQAVHKGQREAAEALALSSGQRMWHVILPQSMRIAVPAIGNQYLNLVKNSSLAAAISYADLTALTRLSISNRSPAIPSFVLLLGIYLIISLTIAAGINLYNRKLAIVER